MPRAPGSTSSSGTASPSRWLRDSLRSVVGQRRHSNDCHAAARRLLERPGEIAFHLLDRRAGLQAAGDLQIPVGRLVDARLRRRSDSVNGGAGGQSCGSITNGTNTSRDCSAIRWMPMNDGGSTPTIVTGVLFRRTVLPTIDGVAAEAPLPEAVADHRDRLRAGLLVGLFDRAAGRRRHAEHLEVVARHAERGGDLRAAVRREVERLERRAGDHIGHRLVGGLQLLVDRCSRTCCARSGRCAAARSRSRSTSAPCCSCRSTSGSPATAGSRTGMVCSSRPFTAVNSAVVAPMPIASDSRTTMRPALRLHQHPVGVLEVMQHGGYPNREWRLI